MKVSRVAVTAFLCFVLQSNEAVGVSRVGAKTFIGADAHNLEVGMGHQVESLIISATKSARASQVQESLLELGSLATSEAEVTNTIVSGMTIQKAHEIVTRKAWPGIKALLLAAPGYAGVQKGQDMLNKMIEETMEKLDLERQQCANFITTQGNLVEVTTQDIRMFDARAAGAREDVLAAQAEIERLTNLLPQLTSTLEAHNHKCDEEIASLEAQLKIVLGDIDVMASVLELTECKASLVQHTVLRTAAAKLTSTKARRLVKERLDQACTGDIPVETPDDSPQTLLQLSAHPSNVEPAKLRAKCTLSKNSCKNLRDKFLQIQSGIEAKREELMAEVESLRRHCTDEKANLESQISDAELDLKNQQTNLAKATKVLNDAERNSKLKDEEKVALEAELLRMSKLCEVNIANYISEKCALDKIRGELEQMKGHTNPAFLQDCEVTDWSVGQCSVTCGGGGQSLTRSVSVHPVGGAACPPLEMKRSCNENECPIDCELQDWSGWGDCSAECNGGVKEKIRNILVVPQFGGAPCGETSEAESCNVQSCDTDCILSDWGKWSECSKECNGGSLSRTKAVVEEAVGGGTCTRAGGEARLEYMPCNAENCTGNATCESKLDVVLLLDGSGSLGVSGWEQTKNAAEMFVNALHGDQDHVMLSVIVFSGPTTWYNYHRCTGTGAGAKPDLKEDCGIDIVQHFTSDMDAAKDEIKALVWPAKTTLTSTALMIAGSELSLGRKDAESVVIVITDGKPLNAPRTKTASEKLRRLSRVMWVTVTMNVPMSLINNLASKPLNENVIHISDFKGLSDPETITTIIADMCPKIKQ